MVIAGDLAGDLKAWKPEFPGAWGYTPRPYLTFQDKPGFPAHTSALIGLEVSDERVISCSSDGTLSFWSFADAKEDGTIHPSFSTSLEGVPLCFCGTKESVVFVGFKDGSVRKIERKKTKCNDSMVLAPSDAGVARCESSGGKGPQLSWLR